MALTCADLRRLMDEDAPLDAGEARQHLAGCDACRTSLERWELAVTKLREWGEQVPPPFLHGRLMAHVRAEGKSREPRRSWRRLVWAPTLATLALVVTIAVRQTSEVPVASLAPASTLESLGPRSGVPSPAAASPAGTLPRPGSPAPPERTHGPMRGGSTAPFEEQSVACQLQGPGDTGGQRLLTLRRSWAPPPTVAWTLDVATSGEVGPAASLPPGGTAGPIPLETLEVLASLDLLPGRYVLVRTADGTPIQE